PREGERANRPPDGTRACVTGAKRVIEELDRLTEAHQIGVAPLPPLVRDGEQVEIAEQLVSLLAPDSFAADQYRSLRHSVEALRKEAGLHVIAVTSPAP